ncbi:MAG: TetR/AcrR family transcriptional regulator [Clostridia bacterium]|nr:TetR/AcrR family transcriptional regulator [Clostridia bacterium]
MNKTKRKIFETSMKLFSEKGYDATSIEEITATVGVAKGTLYYHFTSKEEIFNFLVEEGMKLLKNSIEIKTSRCEKTIDKLRAVSLVQLKVLLKYESLLTIVMSQTWGNEPRNVFCKSKVLEHISVIEKIIKEGQEKGDFFECNSELMACEIFSLTCSTLIYLRKTEGKLDVQKLYKEYEKTLFEKLDAYKGE